MSSDFNEFSSEGDNIDGVVASATTAVATSPESERGLFGRAAAGAKARGKGTRSPERWAVPGFLGLLILIFSLLDGSKFLTQTNFITIIQSNSAIVLLALIATFMIRAGTIDFSLAASMILGASVVAVLTTEKHWSVPLAIIVTLAITGVIGAFNGFIVVVLGLDGFIATLGMNTVLTGVALAVTNDNVVTPLPHSLVTFASKSFGDFPLSVIYGWVLALILWGVFEFTPFGRILAFVGGNQVSARLAGIRVPAIRFSVFVVAAVLAGFTGVVLAGSLNNVDPTSGGNYLLGPFSSAFLGASAIQIGRFNVAGTITAVYLVAVAETGLELLGVSPWVSEVFNGGALIAAIAFSRLSAVRASRVA
jgi:ribose transport system permease protein